MTSVNRYASVLQHVRHMAEFAGFMVLYGIIRIIPLNAASALGGFLGRTIGPHLRQTRYARRNLSIAFPLKTPAEREMLIVRNWDHLGRMIGEIGHLTNKKIYSRIVSYGSEHLPPPGKAVLFVSGHFGQWELLASVPRKSGLKIGIVYRRPNNPFIDRIITRIRLAHADVLFAKGQTGNIKIVKALKNGSSLALLIDQKLNEGIAIPFFGQDAMTAPGAALMAIRHNLPIIPTRVVRKKGCHFEATTYAPLDISLTGDEEADIKMILCRLHKTLEDWIEEYPEQWLWMHRRWDKENYDNLSA